jgi:RNA polymerase sigma-70 factor (ECF subfamily)
LWQVPDDDPGGHVHVTAHHDGGGAYPTTQWSLVRAASSGEEDARRDALTQLVRRYVPVLVKHLVRGRKLTPDQADDVVQSFLADKVLADGLIGFADPTRGRFRAFLATSLDRYLVSYLRAENAKKRGGGTSRVELEAGLPVVDRRAASPDRSFDVSWARQVLADAVNATQAECLASGRGDVWGVFEGRVLAPLLHGGEQVAYSDLVARYGFVSPSQASNVLVTANRMFVRELRRVVGAYTSSDAETEEEIADLRRILTDSA